MSDQNWNKRISNPETTKIFTPSLTEGINQMVLNKDLILPVINAVEDQNIHLRQQIDKFSKQFKKLDALSSNLLAENLRMRSHYHQRTHDLQAFIETLKINLGSEITDITHESHLLREGNCLLFKNIQTQMGKNKEYDERIEELRGKLIELKESNTYQEEHVLFPLKVRLQNKLNSNTIKSLSQKQDKITQSEEKLWSEVSNLVFAANQIERQNIQNSKAGWIERNDNQVDKQHYKNNIIQALKSLNELKTDLQTENAVANTQNQIYKGLTDKLKELDATKKKKNSEKEQKILLINKLRALREYQTKDIYETRKIVSEMQVEVMKRNQQKERLMKLLQNKKKTYQNMKQKHEEQKKSIEDKGTKDMEEVRRKIKQVEVKFDQQLQQTNQAMQTAQSTADSLTKELKQLSNDYQYYSKVCKTVENPIKQIERAEFKLKYALNNRRQ